MFLPRSSCIICGEHISKIQYNLKTTYTKKTKVTLINLVEKLYKNIFFLHCNICQACYDLLNELDTVKQRQKELSTKLKAHISKIDKSNLDTNEPNDYYDDDDDDSFDYFNATHKKSSSKVQEKNEVSMKEEVKVGDIDFKKLPITIKRVKSEINPSDPDHEEEMITLISPKKSMSKTARSRLDVDENNKLFEKIQSSIQTELSRHVKQQQEKDNPDKNFLCEICGIGFKTQLGYANHIKKHDNSEDEMKLLALNKIEVCICNVCGKHFNQKGSLRRHLPIHTGVTRYQCHECGKNFIHHSSFRMHQKIHANKRDAKCEVCNHAFLTRSHLKRHLRTAHDKAIKSYECKICNKKFVEQYNLNAHIRTVHKQNEHDDNINNVIVDRIVENNSEVVTEELVIYDMQETLEKDEGLLTIHEPSTGIIYTI